MPTILRLPGGRTPDLSSTSWVAPNATVVGNVHLADGVSVWYGAVIRAEHNRITIGPNSNVQDGAVIHVDKNFPTQIGEQVTVGHHAVVHGATVEHTCLIGINSTVLNGAHIGHESLVAAGSVVTPGMKVPPQSLVAGVPARIIRPLTEEEISRLQRNASIYLEHTVLHGEAERL